MEKEHAHDRQLSCPDTKGDFPLVRAPLLAALGSTFPKLEQDSDLLALLDHRKKTSSIIEQRPKSSAVIVPGKRFDLPPANEAGGPRVRAVVRNSGGFPRSEG